MGGSTSNFGFPYPTGGDPALVAKAFKDLADAVDGWLLEYKYQNVDRALRFGSDPDFNHPFVLSSESGVFSVTPKWTATGTMQYRTSRSGSWSACTSGTAVTGSNYYEFKGNMDRVGLFTSNSNSNKWTITGSNVKASGRLASTHSYGVSATTLATYCYSNMFYSCSSLTAVPALPATTLTTACYNSMFIYCSSLEVRTVSGGAAINQWKIPKSANAVSVGSFALGAMFDGIKSSANQVASTPTLTAGNQLTLYVVNTPAE